MSKTKSPSNKDNRLSLSKEVRDNFDSMMQQLGYSSNNIFMSELLETYKTFKGNYSPKEQQLLDEVVKKNNVTMGDFVKQAVLTLASRVKKGKVEHQKSKEANEQLSVFVEKIKQNNKEADSDNNKLYINQTSLLKFCKAQGHFFNLAVIKRYLEQHKEEIRQHHQDCGIDTDHNKHLADKAKITNSKKVIA